MRRMGSVLASVWGRWMLTLSTVFFSCGPTFRLGGDVMLLLERLDSLGNRDTRGNVL